METNSTRIAARAMDAVQRRKATTLFTVDSHTAGNPTRVVFGDLGVQDGMSVIQARDHLRDNADWIRRVLVHEPRGGNLMCAVYPFASSRPDADVAAVIMEQDEYVPMCGHCMIGLATTLVELGLVDTPLTNGARRVAIETPAGIVDTTVAIDEHGVGPVTLRNVPAFVAARSVPLTGLGGLTADVLYGGDYYITVDSVDVGLELGRSSAASIIARAKDIRNAFSTEIRHPSGGAPEKVYQVMFRQVEAEDPLRIRNSVVAPPGELDRSPCGTGTSALTAWAVAEGLVAIGEDLVSQGITGTTFVSRAAGRVSLDGVAAIIPEVTGSAHLTGMSTWIVDPADPFPAGFTLHRDAEGNILG